MLRVKERTLKRQLKNFYLKMRERKRIDETESYTLDGIRNSLIRQEDSIIFSLVERAQYCFNAEAYDPAVFVMDGFHGSEVEYIVKETEKLHAKVLHSVADSININVTIWDMYFNKLLPRLVKEGDDGNFGSTAVCDTICLQLLRVSSLFVRLYSISSEQNFLSRGLITFI